MILKYKGNEWKITAPNTSMLLHDMIKSETNKKYITLRQCAKLLYSISNSLVVWNDNEYKAFIGSLDNETSSFYRTKMSSSKGNNYMVNRENINTMKNDFDYLLKLFSVIQSSMIIDRKFKLFVE